MKILEKILYYGLILALFTPLVIGESLIFPFITIKAYFFYILIDILLVIYLVLLSQQALYPKRNKLFLFFIVLIGLDFILDLFGISIKNSFWGNYERMMGIYTSLHLLIYLWLLLSVFNTREKYYRLLNISLVSSFLVAIYGFLQATKLKFFGMITLADNRIAATFGNSAYLAGFVLLFIFIALYLLFNPSTGLRAGNHNKYWRYFYIVSILSNIVILFLTATRGALVGLVFASLVMLFLLILFYKNKKIKIASASLLVLIILFSVSIFVFKDSALIKSNLALRRISEINLQETTTASRLTLWKMSLNAMKDKPIVGYGQNNIRVPLDRYHDYSLMEDWFDSSHNKFLDQLLAHGLIGFLAQLVFFGSLLWFIFKKRKQDIISSIILIGLLVAYITQAMFIFDSFILSVAFIFILGFLFINDSPQEDKKIFNKNLSIYVSLPIIIVLGIIFSFVYSNSISSAKKIALAYSISNTDINEVINLYQEVDEKLFANYDILAPTMGKTALEIFNNDQPYTDVQLKNYIELTAKVYKQAIEDSGHYSKFYVNLAKLYQLASKHPRLDYVDESIELLNQALEISPGRIDIYYALAQGYFIKGDFETAQEWLYKALAINVRPGEIYYRLAEIQVRKAEPSQALESMTKAEENGRILTFMELEGFARLFIEREEWQAAADIFIKMVALQPDNTDIYFNIALSYAKLGDRAKAIEWISKVSEADSSLQEVVDEFINNL